MNKMEIDDILKNPEKVKESHSLLIQEMYKTAGKELTEQVINTFGDEDYARNWFYSSLFAFGWKRPYDYCKEGKISEVKDELGRIEHGISS